MKFGTPSRLTDVMMYMTFLVNQFTYYTLVTRGGAGNFLLGGPRSEGLGTEVP